MFGLSIFVLLDGLQSYIAAVDGYSVVANVQKHNIYGTR